MSGNPQMHNTPLRRDVSGVDYLVAGYMLLVGALEPTIWWAVPNFFFGAVLIALGLRVARTALIGEAVVRDPVVWIALALVVWLMVCAGLAPHPAQARAATEYLAKVLLVGIVILAGASRFPRLRLWLAAFVVGAAGLAWGTLATTFEAGFLTGVRATGLARQENVLGQAMVAGIAASLLLMPLVRTSARRVLVLQAGVFLMALMISGSRGAAVSGVAMIATYVALEQLPRLRRYSLRLIVGAALGFTVLGILGGVLSNTPLVLRLLAMLEGGLDAVTSDARWDIYSHAWELFRQNAVVGVGLGNYQFYNPAYVYTHTAFLELLVGGGIAAAALYYLLIAVVFGRCWQAARRYRECVPYRMFFHSAAAVVMAITVQGAFSLAFNSKQFTVLLFLVAGAARAAVRYPPIHPRRGDDLRWRKPATPELPGRGRPRAVLT